MKLFSSIVAPAVIGASFIAANPAEAQIERRSLVQHIASWRLVTFDSFHCDSWPLIRGTKCYAVVQTSKRMTVTKSR